LYQAHDKERWAYTGYPGIGYSVNAFQAGPDITYFCWPYKQVYYTLSSYSATYLVDFETVTLERCIDIAGKGVPISLNMATITLYDPFQLILHFLAAVLVALC